MSNLHPTDDLVDAIAGGQIKIALCMIVKNESKIIKRCLDRCKPVIDYVSILDTGSTDNTPKIIRRWCKKNNIVGKVHREPFVNFGASRTRSVDLAKETFPEAQYLLLMDADFCLVVEEGWKKDDLSKNSYLLEQRHGNILRHWNTRLISTKYDWRCVGVTHEYWECQEGAERDKIHHLWIDDWNDGGCKADKFIRDERLLKEAIADTNCQVDLRGRYMFYLGETLRNMGKYRESIEWHLRRIRSGGWYEEIYYSKYRIGTCHEYLGEQQLALAAYLEAWSYLPTRVEALYAACALSRKQGQNHLAHMLAMKIKSIPPTTTDILFIEPNIHDYLVDFELSITSYYVGDKNIAKKYTEDLLQNPNVPSWVKDVCKNNLKYYQE